MFAGLVSLYMLTVAIIIAKQGYRPAKFFILAWIPLILGIIIYVMKDVGALQYNTLTNYSIAIGSALEVILLSFALADKINILEAEKRISQAEALRISQENERIIREQNIILEAKVAERTTELKASNEELAKTLKDLQEAETQLVESEKMASLGQLTAGIAHEINNPINFVTSNVSPLKRDVDLLIDMVQQVEAISASDQTPAQKQSEIESLKEDLDYEYLKQEIDFLLKGISDGASRTAEIVKGLRVFSRLDEDDLKRADINEGLDSTLVIVNHLLNNTIIVDKKYSGVPLVECFPGKLNQVFLNMMSNAIHAIHKRWGEEPKGVLTLTTWNDEDNVFVSIKDNGTGMDEDTKKKIFDPFFTTKDVGEGTGLGMSIVYNTIRKHNGSIQINTALGEGTEFIITIPIIHELVKV
jgi:signal transduction histidine kinase